MNFILGTKVLMWNKENRNGVRRLYVKDERIMVTWGQISMKQGCKNEGWNKGNRDEWRGVRDVTEIEQTWRWRRYSGEEAVWNGLCWRSISDWYLKEINSFTPFWVSFGCFFQTARSCSEPVSLRKDTISMVNHCWDLVVNPPIYCSLHIAKSKGHNWLTAMY